MLITLLAACFLFADKDGDDSTPTPDDSSVPTEVCTEPVEPTCVDEMISDLSFQDEDINEDEVSTETDGADFVTFIDASAGGYGQETRHAWQYIKFTDAGAESVDMTDEDALESMDWDLSARRFILRLNGGSSGPSCVGAAVMGEGYSYETLTEVPAGIQFAVDDFYTDDCTLINDSSGLQNSPQTVLSPWWNYSTCVETSGQPFLIQTSSGRVLKLVVENYYDGEGQVECNESGSTREPGGYYRIRWQFLD